MTALLIVAGCGRVGFAPLADATMLDDDASLKDAPPEDASMAGCQQDPPYLHLISPREEGSNGGAVPVSWCSSGVTGLLTASMVEVDRTTIRGSSSVPIGAGATTIIIGVECSPCFIRLQAGGITVDGPLGAHLGD